MGQRSGISSQVVLRNVSSQHSDTDRKVPDLFPLRPVVRIAVGTSEDV